MNEVSPVIPTVLMVVGLLLAFIPVVPGPVLLWAVAIVYAVVDGFTRITPAAAVTLSLAALVGSTSDLWLPLFGVRTGGMSCLGAVGGFVGAMLGTILLPIPILGTLIGAVVGAVGVEFLRHQNDPDRVVRAGKTALILYTVSYIVQIVASLLIFAVFVVSLISTQQGLPR